MTPFNGDRVRPRITAQAGGKTFSWLFDTGASITCMTQASFLAAFPHTKPHRLQNSQHCTAASGNKLNSLGIYEIDLFIKGKKFTHPINVMDTLTDNIIRIDFMHKNKLHYNVQSKNKCYQLLLPQSSQPDTKAKPSPTFISSQASLHPKIRCYLACPQLSQLIKTIIAK
jgi:hypothetical protein